MQDGGSMRVVGSVLAAMAVLGALGSGCGSAESLSFAEGHPTVSDAADETPYPDGSPPDAAKTPETDVGPPEVKCPPGKDGKANVCVRVLRGSEGPSYTLDAKDAFGVDGRGAVLIGLTAVKPTGRDVSFVAQTWFPTESSGTGKFAASELPKVAELAVPPGTYWAFAVFRDQEPYNRPGVAVGDYVPRLVELPQITVVAHTGSAVDVRIHPVRAVDLELRLTATPAGSGAGPLAAWLIDEKKIVGEGRKLCAELSGGRSEVVRVFSTYTGTFDVGAALFDFTAPPDDGSATMPTLPPGTAYNELSTALGEVKILEGDWLMPTRKRIDLTNVVPLGSPKPTDSFPTCASYSYAPPM